MIETISMVILVIYLLIAVGMVTLILLQRAEGGALGMGGGGAGMMTGRQPGSGMTRATAILAALFMITSLALVVLSGQRGDTGKSDILDDTKGAPAAAPAAPPAPYQVAPPLPAQPAPALSVPAPAPVPAPVPSSEQGSPAKAGQGAPATGSSDHDAGPDAKPAAQ